MVLRSTLQYCYSGGDWGICERAKCSKVMNEIYIPQNKTPFGSSEARVFKLGDIKKYVTAPHLPFITLYVFMIKGTRYFIFYFLFFLYE
jgi:hypothetical protein